MPFINGKEDMGLEASLKLLDLTPDATIDDANQAYSYLHRMIDLFHKDAGTGNRGRRQEDMELLTCAYEKAVAYLADGDRPPGPLRAVSKRSPAVDMPEATDLHFTINFPAGTDRDAGRQAPPPLPEINNPTVEEAISITSRCLEQTEAALPDAQQAVETAVAAAEAANRRYAMTQQARMNAVVAAQSSKTRAQMLEIEAQRATDEAKAVAERARERAAAAKQAALDAHTQADQAREQAGRVAKSEETAAAAVVCAEDRLEKAKARLKGLTHTLLQARNRMALFQGARAETKAQEAQAQDPGVAAAPGGRPDAPPALGAEAASRQRIMSDLLAIEASLNARKEATIAVDHPGGAWACTAEPTAEKRRQQRIVYPPGQRPVFSIDGRSIPILDLSTTGMRLEADAAIGRSRIVRGTVLLSAGSPLQVTGKVIHQDDQGLGVKLVTRIGNAILDQERLHLSA
jgi:hypothetical protein